MSRPHRLASSYTLAVGAVSATQAAAAFPNGITAVRLVSTTACHVFIGIPTGTALATHTYLPANFPEVFGVVAGQKVSVIQDAAGGTLSITELSS